MIQALLVSFIYFTSTVLAHGDHSNDASASDNVQYAQRHMSSEHHIDSFDIRSFFQLHDLNRDSFLDKEEIEALYGVHHVYSQKKSKDDIEHQKKADHIVAAVLRVVDTNKDGKVSAEELEAAGLDALPNFDHMGAEGHHYDVESEFFLHHEEQFHSTPETQTDESYNHPEDLEHFAHHQEIEYREAVKEAEYQGISVEEALKAHEPPPKADGPVASDNINQVPIAAHPHDEQIVVEKPLQDPAKPKVTRVTPPEKQDPAIKFGNAKTEGEKKGAWGTGQEGFKPPTNPGDKMRKNLPYKYKFRKSWQDF